MKIICTQENLKIGLQQVARIVGSSSTLPILNNILLQTENGQLKISATNLEMGINTLIRCKIEQDGGVCVSAKVLLDLINNLPNENILIETKENDVLVATERYQTKIKYLPTEDFPLIPEIDNSSVVEIPSRTLKETIDSVLFAVSTSETQPEISGVLFKLENNILTITTTDRYRLAEMKLPVSTSVSMSVILPNRSVGELSRLLANVDEPINLHISSTQIALSVNGTYMVTRLIDGQYPEYSQIIPEESGAVITLERSEFLSALKTSGIFSKGVGSITIDYHEDKQTIYINSSSQGVGESVIEIPCTIKNGSGSVIMNYRYILDFLVNTTDATLNIHIIDDTNPVVFKPKEKPNYLYLIMPIRL